MISSQALVQSIRMSQYVSLSIYVIARPLASYRQLPAKRLSFEIAQAAFVHHLNLRVLPPVAAALQYRLEFEFELPCPRPYQLNLPLSQ
jgi:hypothetical protein